MHDLTHPITSGMQTYPGDPSVTCTPALRIATDGVSVGHWGLGSHTGTHVDAPAHVIDGGRTLAEVGLHELCGEAIVLRVEVSEGAAYGLAELEAGGQLPARLPPIVVIDTGWASCFGTERALRHPYLEGATAAELLRRGMHVLAVDTHSPDPTHLESEMPVHRAVLGADGLIVENLTRLAALPPRTRVGFFPLRLDGDGAPVRAVAFDETAAGQR